MPSIAPAHAHRYAEVRDKQLKQYVPVDGEIYVSLHHLQEAMTTLSAALLAVWQGGEFPAHTVLDEDEVEDVEDD